MFDVITLEKLCLRKIEINNIVMNCKSFEAVQYALHVNTKRKEKISNFLPLLQPLKSIVSKEMMERMAEHGLAYECLVTKYAQSVQEAKNYLHGCEPGGSPIIIRTKKILDKILSHLQSTKENSIPKK